MDLFATGGADALIAYSERLNVILPHPGRAVGDLHVASATTGGGDHPALFTGENGAIRAALRQALGITP